MLAIDCEFNGWQGELISMALVSSCGEEFYEVINHDHLLIEPWVGVNALPILNKESVSFEVFQQKLENFLQGWDNPLIIADWHDDIKYLCESIIVGPGLRLNTPPLRMEVRDFTGESKIPHNALEDARGNLEALIEEGVRNDCR